MSAFTIIVISLTIIVLYNLWRNRQKRINKQKELTTKYLSYYEIISRAVINFESLISDDYGKYLTYSTIKEWENEYNSIFDNIRDLDPNNTLLNKEKIKVVNKFIRYYTNLEDLRSEYNNAYVEGEMVKYKKLFDDINGIDLNYQQRKAIVTDEDNNLIIAGSGTGKTTTIVGKVRYLLESKNVYPSDLLLISFTRKSANSLKDKIGSDKITASTFHKFGKEIIVNAENKQPSIFGAKNFKPLLRKMFDKLIESETYLNKVNHYVVDYMKEDKSQFEFESHGEYIQYIKDQNFIEYKRLIAKENNKKTYNNEVVKSIEECKIANFLYFNNVKYKYEFPYEVETSEKEYRQYKPDFSIFINGQRIYLEHFAINEDNSVPPFFAKGDETIEDATADYLEEINWKRKLHKKHNTILIETYSYEMDKGILYENLRKRLEKNGIKLNPKPPKEVWNIIKKAGNVEIKNLINLFGTFINLLKSNNSSIEEVLNKNNRLTDKARVKSNRYFIDIIEPIYNNYQKYLKKRNEIDFNDMINKATEYINNGQVQINYKYIIIDEFQDISVGRYNLINAVRKNSPGSKTYCVGDDWQSIFRFSGSDITLYKNFHKYFGFTNRLKLEITHRFSNPLLNMSSEFVQQNPTQSNKKLKSHNPNNKTEYKIMYNTLDKEDVSATLKNIFDELIKRTKRVKDKDVLILGRYRFDIDKINTNKSSLKVSKRKKKIRYHGKKDEVQDVTIDADFMTIHKSKGLEADVVIIINCISGKYGFPSKINDNSVLDLLLSEPENFEYAEERRLFYVGLTRAREMVYLITHNNYKSRFILEIESTNEGAKSKKCPHCNNGDLVKRKGSTNSGKEWAFWGCTNYKYGCEYKKWIT